MSGARADGGTARLAYGVAARWYDVASGEPVYRAGRVAGIAMLGLRAGDVVLDVGCGTGLNLPALVAAVGPAGRVVGVDRSPAMLAVARAKAVRHGWRTVELVQADVTDAAPLRLPVARVDAVLATYALSVTEDPDAAWRGAMRALRPGGRACVVDMQRPTGRARALAPLARLACAMGGADIDAHPWRILEAEGSDVERREVRGGHVVAVAGTVG